MNGYFYVLTAIDLFVLSFMCILTKFSESLNKKQKRGFFLAFALIAGISVLEVVTLAVDGAPAGYRWLNILSNYLGFGLSPAVSLCLVYVMDRKKMVNFWFRAAVCCEGCYLLFLALSIPAGLVFSVSEDNVYSRGPYFCIYAGVTEPQPGADLPPDALSDHRDHHSGGSAEPPRYMAVRYPAVGAVLYLLQ